jgi:hypothetical protein
MNNFNKEVRKAYIRGIFNKYEKYEKCSHDMEKLQAILAEYGFDYVDHSCCDGFCPDCGQMCICEAYEELKDEWEGFYT